jgi:hypothetical protein
MLASFLWVVATHLPLGPVLSLVTTEKMVGSFAQSCVATQWNLSLAVLLPIVVPVTAKGGYFQSTAQ